MLPRSLRPIVTVTAAIVVVPCYGDYSMAAPIELSVQVGGFLRASYSVDLSGGEVTCTTVRAGKVVKTDSGRPKSEDWAKLRASLDTLDIWKWRRSYMDETVLDGTQWSIAIKYSDRSVVSEGSNSYPTQDGLPSATPEQTAAFRSFRGAVASLVDGCKL